MSREHDEFRSRITEGKTVIGSSHFVPFCEDGSPASSDASRILSSREDALKEIASYLRLSVSPETSVTLVMYEDPETKTRETGHVGNGWALDSMMIELYSQETKVDPYHELVHIVAGKLGSPPALYDEGLAVYLASIMWRGQPTSELLSHALRMKQEPPSLIEVMDFTEIGPSHTNPKVSYSLAAAFVAHLIEKDKARFLELYRRLESPSTPEGKARNRQTLESVAGQSMEDIIKEFWRVAERTAG